MYSNGVIRFGERPIVSSPSISAASGLKYNIIAPYWATMDPRKGSVFYHLYETCGSPAFDNVNDYGSPMQYDITTRAERDIAQFYQLDGFVANTILLVTWDSVQCLSQSNDVS